MFLHDVPSLVHSPSQSLTHPCLPTPFSSLQVAAEICEHLTMYGEDGCAPPSACVATCPAYVKDPRAGDDLVPFRISERDMLKVTTPCTHSPPHPAAHLYL